MALEGKRSRVRVSKNRKKNWNKYCDIKDVEEFLEEKRFEARIGGSIHDKPVEDLCIIQTDSKNIEPLHTKKGLSKRSKCFQNIGAYSEVPPPHNRTLKSYSKKIKNLINKADKKRWKEIVSKSKKKEKNDEKIMQIGDMYKAEMKDLWANEDRTDDSDIKELILFRDEYTKRKTPKIPTHRFQKPSLLPAVEVPHSGASYNPSFHQHQELLQKALQIEEAKKREESHLERVLTSMFPTRAEAPTSESILQEMSQGLFDEEASDEELEETKSVFTWKPPISSEDRLTKSRKRKRKELKEEARKRQLEKLEQHRLRDVFRIKSLKNEIKKEKELSKQKQNQKLNRRIEKMYKPQTLGKYKYEEPDLEVNLSEELCDSLRHLKTEGNLLEDRFKSLQRRNLIEPRIKQKRKRKYKLKIQVKRNHRD